MTRLLLLALCLALALAGAALPGPGRAEDSPRQALLAPEPGCAAPALLPAATFRQVAAAAEEEAPPPFRLALLACAREATGPRKRPLRRT